MESNLKTLLQKLGHKLEEIRVRALKNILSKLDHGLLCDADLVQEKYLHIQLLEWFNLPSCPMVQEVLALITRLTKHQSAAQIYMDLGAVEFLTQLRGNLPAVNQGQIDTILDQLFHLPNNAQQRHLDHCIYKGHSASLTQEETSHYLESSLRNVPSPAARDSSVAERGSHGEDRRFPSPPESHVGYFKDRSQDGSRISPSGGTQGHPPVLPPMASCFRFSTFPWVTLTATDKHVLSSTDNSLKSSDAALVVSACEFLSDVVFLDFPAEVFLQRPSMVKSLLSLLRPPSSDPSSSIEIQAAATLHDLAKCIQMRIYFYQDPSVYSPKQDLAPASANSSSSSFLSHSLASSDTRPSVVGRSEPRPQGDGQDRDSSSSSAASGMLPLEGELMEQTDLEEMHSLQFMQWAIPQFCTAVLDKVLPCLKSSHQGFLVNAIQLLQQVTALLKESVDVNHLWVDQSVPARDMVEKLSDCLEMLGDVLFLHHHANLNKSTPHADLAKHRISFTGMAAYACDFLKSMVPEDQVTNVIPQEFVPVLTMLAEDESLSYSYPEVRSTALEFLHQMDLDTYHTFRHAQEVCQSLKSSCGFLMELDDLSDEKIFDLMSSAVDGMPSLIYHLSPDFIAGCIHLCSFICKKQSPNPTCVRESRHLVLELLAHPVESIRFQAYDKASSIVKDALGVEHVTEPTSSATSAVSFIIDPQILYQIVTFGMNDDQPKIVSMAESILVYLLQSQLLLPVPRWQHLLEALRPLIAALQCHSSKDSTLGKCILSLASTEAKSDLSGTLPFIERFRATLRLMFHPDKRLRAEGLGRLAYFLAHEEDSLHKSPLFSEMDVSKLTALLIIDPPRSLIDDDLSPSVFQADGLQKVLEIFCSSSIEPSVRKSAAEQLAIMLQDPGLHEVFCKLGGLEQIHLYMKTAVLKPEPDENPREPFRILLPAMLKMLHCLVQADFSIRHQMAHDSNVYFTVIRSALLHGDDWEARKEAAELLTFLLFDELASVDTWVDGAIEETPTAKKTTFSLPQFVTKRYRLPLRPAEVHKVSPHACVLPPELDPLRAGLLAEMLRLSWNRAWHDGLDEVVRAAEQAEAEEDTKLFSSRLRLTLTDAVILRTTHTELALKRCVHNIENATSHQAVTTALVTLGAQVVIGAERATQLLSQSSKWTDALERFLLMTPSSTDDELLLTEILHLFSLVLLVQDPTTSDVTSWLSHMIYAPNGALIALLKRPDIHSIDDLSEPTLHVRRQLNRQLLKFIQNYVARSPYPLTDRKQAFQVHGELALGVLSRIHRPNTVQSYNLPSLEATLTCLMHITARPGWSIGSKDADSLNICLQMLQCLLEVVSAFHVGRGGMSMSFMGRGVTRSATLCLRHLAHEMNTQLQSKDWPRNWLFARQATPDSVGESGLHWLIPLWTYRDTEVRAAGIGIAGALASTESGRITLATQCQHIPGGIWGAAFSLLLDQAECSMVREQAAILLVNMTSKPLPRESVESATNVWQGPIIRNEETQVSLVGLPALLALLQHSQFFAEMIALVSSYYAQPAIHPISIANGLSPAATSVGSQLTMTTADTASHATETASPSQLLTSTPVSQRRPQDSSSAEGNAASIPGDSEAAPRSASTSPLTPRAEGHSTSRASTDISGCRVASPCLISAICRLISNLLSMAPKETISSVQEHQLHSILISLVDVALLEAYAAELRVTEYKRQFFLAFSDLLHCYSSVLELLTQVVIQAPATRGHLLKNTSPWKNVIKILGVAFPDHPDMNLLCERLWESTFRLLGALFQSVGRDAILALGSVSVKSWPTTAGRLVTIMQDPAHADSTLLFSAHVFLAALLSNEAQLISKMGDKRDEGIYMVSDRLDKPSGQDQGDLFTGSTGAVLCSALVKNFDCVLLRPMEQNSTAKTACIGALKAVLIVSTSAKMAALEAGLVETLCEHIRHLHSKLSLQSLDLAKLPPSKKRNPLLTELHLTLDLLRNFMFENEEIKIAAYESGLSNAVHKIWAWCQMDPPVMMAALSLLGTYTARCPQASSSLALTSAHDNIDKVKGHHSSSSLVHCLMKLAQKEGGSHGNPAMLRAAFTVMSTLALSSECAGILWKSNFLHQFSQLSPKKARKTKVQQQLELLWLQLMTNLSFSLEGQNLILKITDSVDLLVEFGLLGHEQKQKYAVLILRNLGFHSANKPKLLANDKVLPFLLRCVEAGGSGVKSVACSALFALVYNSQKAKGLLKNPHVLMKLEEEHKRLSALEGVPWAETCADNIQSITFLLNA